MKKVLLTSACVLAMAGAAFAQGKINWSAISASGITAQTNSTTYSSFFGGGATGNGSVGVAATSATGFYWQLLTSAVNVPVSGAGVAQPSSLAALGTWSAIAGATGNNSTTSAGRLVPITPNTSLTVPWAVGVTQNVMMVGWSANLGTDWATAYSTLNSASALGNVIGSAFFGISNTGYITGNAADPGVTVFANAAGSQGLPIFSLNTQLYLVPVPEPSTLVLAGLGGLSLLAFRRKK